MTHRNLDRLRVTLDVAVEAFAICEVRRDYRLIGKPANFPAGKPNGKSALVEVTGGRLEAA